MLGIDASSYRRFLQSPRKSEQDIADEDLTEGDATPDNWQCLPRHRDEDQVQLDVNRSFIYYPSSMFLATLKFLHLTDCDL